MNMMLEKENIHSKKTGKHLGNSKEESPKVLNKTKGVGENSNTPYSYKTSKVLIELGIFRVH